MRYQYTYRNTAWDLWQLSMYYTYGSLVGMCNAIFTVAMIILTVKQWNQAEVLLRLFLLLGCGLFLVIQPLIVYFRAKRQAAGITMDTELSVDESGIQVKAGEQLSRLSWSKVKKISKKPTMIILFANTTHGFVLTNQVLGEEKGAFYTYVSSKVKQ